MPKAEIFVMASSFRSGSVCESPNHIRLGLAAQFVFRFHAASVRGATCNCTQIFLNKVERK